MASYSVSFHIGSVGNYGERYQSLMAEIRSPPTVYAWDETTSFILVETPEALATLASRLYLKTEIDSTKDILLVFDHARSQAIARGPIQYPATLKARFVHCEIK